MCPPGTPKLMDAPVFYRRHPFCFYLDSFILPGFFCFCLDSSAFARILLFLLGLFCFRPDSFVFTWALLFLLGLFCFYLDSSAFTRTLLFVPKFFTFIIIYFCSAPIVKSPLVPIPLSIFHKHKSRQGKRHQFRCRSCQPDAVHPKEQRKDNHGDEHKYERPGKCKDSRNNPIR